MPLAASPFQKLVPVTNTLVPSRATDTAAAPSKSLPGPLYRWTHSFAPGTAIWRAAASDDVLAGCGAWAAAPAALTPSAPATAPAATTADARAINLRMADLPADYVWLPIG